MQREFSKLKQRNFDLEQEVNSLQAYKSTHDLKNALGGVIENLNIKKETVL
ncbi:hypothetical protein QSV37_15140 [Acinetobacter sp. VNK23]|nr:hypothetical protein [Acinetobacter thutiue]MDM1021627.1 hypothetical protein [Acinetobacter thutiue]